MKKTLIALFLLTIVSLSIFFVVNNHPKAPQSAQKKLLNDDLNCTDPSKVRTLRIKMPSTANSDSVGAALVKTTHYV